MVERQDHQVGLSLRRYPDRSCNRVRLLHRTPLLFIIFEVRQDLVRPPVVAPLKLPDLLLPRHCPHNTYHLINCLCP